MTVTMHGPGGNSVVLLNVLKILDSSKMWLIDGQDGSRIAVFPQTWAWESDA